MSAGSSVVYFAIVPKDAARQHGRTHRRPAVHRRREPILHPAPEVRPGRHRLQQKVGDASRAADHRGGSVPPRWGRRLSVVEETAEAKSFRLQVPNSLAYRPGQFPTIGISSDQGMVARCYSMSSAPRRRHHDHYRRTCCLRTQVGRPGADRTRTYRHCRGFAGSSEGVLERQRPRDRYVGSGVA